jgi:hypothetical protein
MFKILSGLFFMACFIALHVQAQVLHWAEEYAADKQYFQVQGGLDISFIAGIGYGRKFTVLGAPAMASVALEVPTGNHVLDDYSIKTGIQNLWWQNNHWGFSTALHPLLRRYHNNFVTLQNIGLEAGLVFGHYRKAWFIAVEAHHDWALMTHFKHSVFYKNNFPEVQDGWASGLTGGSIRLGGQVGFRWKKHGLALQAGNQYARRFYPGILVPLYARLSYTYHR